MEGVDESRSLLILVINSLIWYYPCIDDDGWMRSILKDDLLSEVSLLGLNESTLNLSSRYDIDESPYTLIGSCMQHLDIALNGASLHSNELSLVCIGIKSTNNEIEDTNRRGIGELSQEENLSSTDSNFHQLLRFFSRCYLLSHYDSIKLHFIFLDSLRSQDINCVSTE